MKKTFKFLGIVALTAIINFSMTACSGNNGGGGDDGPTIPPIVNLTPAAIPSSDNPAFTDPGAGGRRTVVAGDMDEVLELLMPVFWEIMPLFTDEIVNYLFDNMDGDSFDTQLQDVPFGPLLTAAGISGLTGRVSAYVGQTSISLSWNNVNYVFRSYEVTNQWSPGPDGTTVVASARWSSTGRGWQSGSFFYSEGGMSVSFAAAFQIPDMYGRAVINFGEAGRGRETADGDEEIFSETAYAVVYLFDSDSNNAQVHRYQAATVERALEIVTSGLDLDDYSAPIGAEAGQELPSGASRWLRTRR
ncbi:MAG: hypothetical protein FWC64_09310 [Treponema sp.]|nr:hypothetical protein [Treponema sp.]